VQTQTLLTAHNEARDTLAVQQGLYERTRIRIGLDALEIVRAVYESGLVILLGAATKAAALGDITNTVVTVVAGRFRGR